MSGNSKWTEERLEQMDRLATLVDVGQVAFDKLRSEARTWFLHDATAEIRRLQGEVVQKDATIAALRAERDAARDVITSINSLRSEEGSSIEILCENQDGEPTNVVVVTDEWTNWKPRRFGGSTLVEALKAAEAARAAGK